MDSRFMVTVAEAVGASGVRVVRFEFPYMAARRKDGRRRAPDREPVLIESWLGVIGKLGNPARLVIGGKSMGGRIASMVADQAGVAGLVCLGYPFHPPGNPLRMRTKHLENLQTPALILQGERDSFGRRDEVADYKLSPKIEIVWLEAGDHSFRPPARSGSTEAQNISEAIARVCAFIAQPRAR
jgi:predicted alpha/beta-hydrolase family hydrolase